MMNPETSPQPSPKGLSILMICLGLIFMALWLAGAFVLGTMKLMASVMANDSGGASPDAHMTLIGGMMVGQILTGVAGIPAGLAFFWRSWRKRLLWTFGLLLIVGLAIQILSFTSFFS
jgi:hypothetical protein